MSLITYLHGAECHALSGFIFGVDKVFHVGGLVLVEFLTSTLFVLPILATFNENLLILVETRLWLTAQVRVRQIVS
jgi:hypothetical protein